MHSREHIVINTKSFIYLERKSRNITCVLETMRGLNLSEKESKGGFVHWHNHKQIIDLQVLFTCVM
jgi:hypothetical protein